MSPSGDFESQKGPESHQNEIDDIRAESVDVQAPAKTKGIKRKYGLPRSKSVTVPNMQRENSLKATSLATSLDDGRSNRSDDIAFVSMYTHKNDASQESKEDSDDELGSGVVATKMRETVTDLGEGDATSDPVLVESPVEGMPKNLSGAVVEKDSVIQENDRSNESREEIETEGNVGRKDSTADREGILTIAYNFLESRSAEILRNVAREWGVKQHQKKEFFVANFMVWLMDQQKEGKSVRSLLELKENWGFAGFLTMRSTNKKYRKVPNWAQIKSKGDPYRKKRDVSGHDSSKSVELNLSEFARLMVLIRDDQDSRAAVLNSRRSSTRPQLDAKVRKDSCWNDTVLKKFNDPEYQPFLDLTAAFRDVDSKRPPVPPPKVGKDLLDAFNDAKRNFGVWYHKWHKSGHRDPEDYGGFRVDDDYREAVPAPESENDISLELQKKSDHFRNFVPRSGPPKLQEEGQKALIIFVTLRCGTKQEDRELLSLFHRGMGGGKGDIQFEAGLPGHDQENTECEGRGAPKRKRRKVGKRRSRTGSSSSDSKPCWKSIQNSISNLADSHAQALKAQSMTGVTSRVNSTVVQDKTHEIGSEREAQLRQCEQVQKVLRLMAEAEEMMTKSKEGSPFYLMARKQFESLQERCQHFMKDQS